MKRLSGLDAGFLAMETPTSHMHVASLMVLDPSTSKVPLTLDAVRDFYESRLHLAAPFRRRLVDVPLGLHHPLWIEDPDFDLDFHLRHTAVPPPGGQAQLANLVSRLVALPLDRSRPLWETWVIEGLEGGRVGVLTKVHHAAIDGASGNEITVAMLQLAPDDEAPPPEQEWQPDAVPNPVELLGHAGASLARQPGLALTMLGREVMGRVTNRDLRRDPDDDVSTPGAFAAPPTSFNAALTSRRSFGWGTLSLPAVKAIKQEVGVTVNDVVLGLCGGALRRYLESQGEVPDGPLVAMVPVSVRTEEQKGTNGNQVSSLLVSLATDVDDPIERLRVISAGTKRAKEKHALSANALQDWAEFAAPALAGRAARLYSRTRIASRHRPLFNVTISNVPGPPFPLYSSGAKLEANYPIGPIFDGGGINMTVMSYQDALDFGINVCPDLVPDPFALIEGLEDELAALEKALG